MDGIATEILVALQSIFVSFDLSAAWADVHDIFYDTEYRVPAHSLLQACDGADIDFDGLGRDDG